MDNIRLRLIALEDAMNDIDPTQYMNDRIVEVDAADLFWGQSGRSIVWFDASTNSVFFATDEYDRTLTMEPSIIGHAKVFKSPNVEMFVVRETDFYSDVDSTIFNASMDLNNEVLGPTGSPDDDDLLVVVASGGRKREYAVIDFSDRNYNAANTSMHSNGMGIYRSFSDSNTAANYASRVAEATATPSNGVNGTRLQSPLNPNAYFLFWGSDQRLEHVGICFGCKAAK
jgi:hypothetical protein